MKPKIILKNVNRQFNQLKVLEDISFNIKQNEFVSIIGQSGCGKTTLLYLIQGFIKQNYGVIETYGKKGFVFQDHNLFPWKTIKQNIEISNKKNPHIKSILINIGLEKFQDYYPNQVSEGMKQRAGIGRSLAYNSDILLMDEPFGALDYLTKLKVQEFLIDIVKKKKLTVLFVTHDIDEAIRLSDRIIVLSKLPARVLKILDVKDNDKNNIKNEILQLLNN